LDETLIETLGGDEQENFRTPVRYSRASLPKKKKQNNGKRKGTVKAIGAGLSCGIGERHGGGEIFARYEWIAAQRFPKKTKSEKCASLAR